MQRCLQDTISMWYTLTLQDELRPIRKETAMMVKEFEGYNIEHLEKGWERRFLIGSFFARKPGNRLCNLSFLSAPGWAPSWTNFEIWAGNLVLAVLAWDQTFDEYGMNMDSWYYVHVREDICMCTALFRSLRPALILGHLREWPEISSIQRRLATRYQWLKQILDHGSLWDGAT